MEIFRVWVGGLIPLAVLIAFLFYDKWRRKKRRERPPIEEKLLRPPGYTLAKRIEGLSEDIGTFMMAAVACAMAFAFITVRGNPQSPTPYLPGQIVFAAASAICVVVVLRKRRDLL